MGLFDKLANLIYEDESSDSKKTKPEKKKGSWTDIFYEDGSETSTPKERKRFSDLFFDEVEETDGIESTFVNEQDPDSVLTDISAQVERRESELINLGEIFKSVNATDYPDSAPEYQAYLSLVKQLNTIKQLIDSGKNPNLQSMRAYQLTSSFTKFETDYTNHIKAIQSLCYLSEIASINSQMSELFNKNFNPKVEEQIEQSEHYISLISKKSTSFDKKYSARIYKELIESEYRLTLLKLMREIHNGDAPRRNPFAKFSPEKKKTFETYLSKDVRDTNVQYNKLADNKDKYVRYGLVKGSLFREIDVDAEAIGEKVNQYTIDNFLLNELVENGEGYETLQQFLYLKLRLNFIDSKTEEADRRVLEDNYEAATAHIASKNSKKGKTTKSGSKRSFPSFDEDI